MLDQLKKNNLNPIGCILDIFFPLFKKIIPFELYRYLAVGGICFLINFSVFHLTYFLLLDKNSNEMFFLNNNMKSLMASMSITLPIGFFLNKNFVFDSSLTKGSSFLRYGISTIASVYFSKNLLDYLVIYLNWNLTLSFLFTTASIQTLNYFFQKKVSFRN
ncbi:hypothetical protein OC25_17465 [Pedobacter kyungheensis]|uniref:GtrA/DPMS transmembrane domain-containing protein n=1 Tax=Pedobacter kyungheensis TaxID=1069985 RepID=A0A0C1FWJ6_9SPHI|nr:hypothetical protein OC25_17465 [Pedobacter kyungheensis]